MKKSLHLWILVLPFFLYYLGAGMNILVVTANRGAMPVYMPVTDPHACDETVNLLGQKFKIVSECKEGQVLDTKHSVAGPTTRLKPLTDWIQLAGEGVCSPGDCFLWLGDFLTYPLVATWLGLLIIKD